MYLCVCVCTCVCAYLKLDEYLNIYHRNAKKKVNNCECATQTHAMQHQLSKGGKGVAGMVEQQ